MDRRKCGRLSSVIPREGEGDSEIYEGLTEHFVERLPAVASLGADSDDGYGDSGGEEAEFEIARQDPNIPRDGIVADGRLLVPRRAAVPRALSRHRAFRYRNMHAIIDRRQPVYYSFDQLQGVNFRVSRDGNCIITIIDSETGTSKDCRLNTAHLNARESVRVRVEDRTPQNLVLISMASDELPSYKFWRVPGTPLVPDDCEPTKLTYAEYIDRGEEQRKLHKLQNLVADKTQQFRPNLKLNKNCAEYLSKRAYYLGVLEAFHDFPGEESDLLGMLEKQFNPTQLLCLLPTLYVGSELDQFLVSNSTRYDALFIRSGPFYKHPKNLATKLTLLHFGFPVAALTENEVGTAAVGGDDSGDNWPDDPIDLSEHSSERTWSEGPLQFLENYQTRLYGYPGLRKQANDLKMVGSYSNERTRHETENVINQRRSIAESYEPRLRGGAGSEDELQDKLRDETEEEVEQSVISSDPEVEYNNTSDEEYPEVSTKDDDEFDSNTEETHLMEDPHILGKCGPKPIWNKFTY